MPVSLTSPRVSRRGRRRATLRHLARATGTGHGPAERHDTIPTTTLRNTDI
jgi:hypothetical protein